jgi:cellulose synthase (UDP-forming)
MEGKYFQIFENRKPYHPSQFSLWKDSLFQIASIVFIFVGIDYLYWRWNHSINWDATWISIPLFIAEIMAFIGSLLTIINYWTHKDLAIQKPIHFLSEIEDLSAEKPDRPIKIDLYIATYNEELDIVEETVRDATKATYPYEDVDIKIHLLDDGHRDGTDPKKENFKALAKKYGINYIVRENNIGFKAGNMNNAFYQTDGDLIVILDADTRIFPGFLEHTTGYFRHKKMGWIQTPQWFYDIPPGVPLDDYLHIKYGITGKIIGKIIPFSHKYLVGKNVFGTDPELFYDVILRRRNAANAAFSCGAGSVQRRKALEQLAIREQQEIIAKRIKQAVKNDPNTDINVLKEKLKKEVPLRPFIHHISEDIFTSIMLHSDKQKWQSYQHPYVECKMLSPQSFDIFIKQFSRYAEGTIDIAFSKNNPVWRKGLTWRQRLAYMETIWSYLSPLWLLIFVLYPIIFFFTLIPPLKAFSFDFFIRIVPFLMLNVIVTSIGNWGKSTKRPEQFYQAGFWYKLQALYKVLVKGNVKFNVTSKNVKYSQSNIKHVWPHLAIFMLTFLGIIYNLYLVYKGSHPSYSAFFANIFWSAFTFYLISPYVRAAFWNEKLFHKAIEHYKKQHIKNTKTNSKNPIE